MKDSKIPWTNATFNPWWGCEKVSPGCTNCYAEAFSRRVGYAVWGAGGRRRTFGPKHFLQLAKWNQEAKALGRQLMVFCASMCDVFEDHPVGEQERPKLWQAIDETPWLIYQLLTKRPENIPRMLPWRWHGILPTNVWVGTTVEDQERKSRIPILAEVNATVRFLSLEPQLEHLGDLGLREHGIGWAITGGESGKGPRIRHYAVDWARDVVRQCREAGIPPFVKQLGSKPIDDVEPTGEFRTNPSTGKREVGLRARGLKLVDWKGEDPIEWPEDLRIREWPTVPMPGGLLPLHA